MRRAVGGTAAPYYLHQRELARLGAKRRRRAQRALNGYLQ